MSSQDFDALTGLRDAPLMLGTKIKQAGANLGPFLRDRTLEPGHAVNLAVFRILVFGLILYSADTYMAAKYADLAAGLDRPPTGLGWLHPYIPISSGLAQGAQTLFVVSCWLALFGLFTRSAALVATLSGLYLLGLPQFAGTVRHYHHLLWFTAILAASPSGDALSLDRCLRVWRGRESAEPSSPSTAYGLPLRVVWILVGMIYFFPGFWKWWNGGLDWALSDNIIHQMHWKWAQNGGWTPSVRVDLYPWLCHLGALWVMCVEVLFLPLQFFRKARLPLLISVTAFHWLSAEFFLIAFPSLWVCYLGLLDWSSTLGRLESSLLGRFSREDGEHKTRSPQQGATRIVGVLLILCVFIAGATRSISGWPFACYPTFDNMVDEGMPSLSIYELRPDGIQSKLKPQMSRIGGDHQRYWGTMWSLVLDRNKVRRTKRLEGHFKDMFSCSEIGAHSEILFHRSWVSTVPEKKLSVMRETLLHRTKSESLCVPP